MITFFVPGIPRPKGSTRSFLHSKTRRIITRASNAEQLEPWEGRIAAFARAAGARASEAPISIALAFTLQRPASHFTRKGLRPTAPAFPAKKPDLDKLTRAVLDALTGIAWVDDQQVVEMQVTKQWADGVEAGVTIEIRESGEMGRGE